MATQRFGGAGVADRVEALIDELEARLSHQAPTAAVPETWLCTHQCTNGPCPGSDWDCTNYCTYGCTNSCGTLC